VPERNDRELLIAYGFQAGLSWITISPRRAFGRFRDPFFKRKVDGADESGPCETAPRMSARVLSALLFFFFFVLACGKLGDE